jgi:hypothetical protein
VGTSPTVPAATESSTVGDIDIDIDIDTGYGPAGP